MAVAAQTHAFTEIDRDAVIQRYVPLVKYVVGRLAIGLPGILEYDDILSYGTIGLIEALDRFDSTKGVKFETYAVTRIRGAIIDALRALDRLPRSVRQKARRLDQLTAELTAALGRDPTSSELAHAMGMSVQQYQRALVDSSWVTVSLDGLLDRDDGTDGPMFEVSDPGDQGDFAGGIMKRQTLDALATAITALPDRERLIISLYYRDGMTMREIAQVLDISESRVCQLHARGLGRLRARMERDRAA